ncbi:MAG TPA: tyrosinase family protein [Intrasporangium sp.]|uniref:tyrosinase family protein n=1 Tax=Intrasporangium sp. TaxID=1925024 RepID=UPI002D7881D2|nr:tyrosinase family protein [Intrasporangium sp.]HET7397326.1 tyrosinase family protein [Intrasporangium sp.]
MTIGDGIRRDIALVSQAERDRLLAAFLALDTALVYPDGVTHWDKQEDIHKNAHLAGVDVHAGPGFVPWHREIVNRLEQLLREVDPELSLHYWDFTVDPRSTAGGRANLFTPAFMGSDQGDAGAPFGAFESTEGGGHSRIWRQVNGGSASLSSSPVSLSDATVVGSGSWEVFNANIQQVHADAHGFIGGTITQPHYSFHDPFVFLLHSNVDRLYAMWQTQSGHPERLDPATVYHTDSADPGLNGPVEPWAGNAANPGLQLRPWAPPDNQQVVKTYKDPSVVAPPCYDTVPEVALLDVVNPGRHITFDDVPTGETTARAAVFRVFACHPVTLRVTAGPGGPYVVLTPGGSITVSHSLAPFSEARIWFGMTGGAAGSVAPAGSVTVHCDQTGQDFVFDLSGNSVARPTVAVMMALDQSGSMDDPAGTAGATRVQVLRQAAGRFAQLIQAGNGLGLIRFDTDAYPVTDPTYPGLAVTTIGPGGDFDPGRVQALTAVANHHTNPAGATSIGDGVVLARSVLGAVPSGAFQQKALIVFTDGLENQPASIDSVAASIDQRTFAIGLGNEAQVSTVALRKLAHNTGGYLLLTGALTPGTDDYFRLSKYFLQILAGVTDTAIVVDPSGYLQPGVKLRIPFVLNEGDIDATVVLLEDLPVIDLSLETPDGDVIDASSAAGVGATAGEGDAMRYFRTGLPVPIGAGAHAGTWHAVLTVDDGSWKEQLLRLRRRDNDGNDGGDAFARAMANGARYSVNVYAASNLRLAATLAQTSIEPGSSAALVASLTEYGLPVEHRARVVAHVDGPLGHLTVTLTEGAPGVFTATLPTPVAGTYHVRVVADGLTLRGSDFTREQLLTAACIPGGDNPPPPDTGGQTGGGGPDLCDLVDCLTEVGAKFLARNGISPDELRRCVREHCRHG